MSNKEPSGMSKNNRSQRRKDVGREGLYIHTPKFDPNILDSLKKAQSQTEEPWILREEVKEAIRRLKNRKAAGIDNIPGELLHSGGKPFIDDCAAQIVRTNLANQCLAKTVGPISHHTATKERKLKEE